MVLNTNTERETGRAAQRGNVQAAKAVAIVKKDPTGPCLKKVIVDSVSTDLVQTVNDTE